MHPLNQCSLPVRIHKAAFEHLDTHKAPQSDAIQIPGGKTLLSAWLRAPRRSQHAARAEKLLEIRMSATEHPGSPCLPPTPSLPYTKCPDSSPGIMDGEVEAARDGLSKRTTEGFVIITKSMWLSSCTYTLLINTCTWAERRRVGRGAPGCSNSTC